MSVAENVVMERNALPLVKREGASRGTRAGSISSQGNWDCGSHFTGWELACVVFP